MGGGVICLTLRWVMPVNGSWANAEPALGAGSVSRPLPAASPCAKEGKMLLADSSYPLLNIFWTMFIFFLWVIWIWILIAVFIDIFRSHDLSGGAKALWFVFVLFIPLLGVLVYLIARGGSMGERAAGGAQR
jgi:hypothetical protein